ncbi:MAG TPA: hypothetical protein VGS22_16265 [Thermoanaerobaculia bacterium]|jgi:hypothetical protein|nr:hypothetical protein [Thermoanaerobaculia bacterium]
MKTPRIGAMLARVEASSAGAQADLAKERAAAGTRLAALLRLPEPERERSLHLDPRCHTVSLGRLLLSSAPADPGEREAYARLALAITDLLPRTGKPPALIASLLLQHEPARAFEAFDRALRGGATPYGGDLKMRADLGAALALERIQDDETPPEPNNPLREERE